MSIIKIILVDDHHIVRDGIKSLLTGAANIEVIGEASDGYELFNLLKKMQPNIVILDLSLPRLSGIEIIKTLTHEYDDIKVLVLSMYTSEDFIFNSIKSGAKGYLPKNTTRKELLEAIYKLHQNEEYFSDPISNIILKSYIKKAKTGYSFTDKKEENLSARELEILKLFAEGFSNKEIAEQLSISIRTVESHKNHIMQKLELKSTVDLVKFAIKNKIIEI
ncbi:MAG: response regulator transcription factor [Bacteroidetes bacterium]|jgi:DNA-binding NarL/FixJ family response regulator|nr:response regulator transcription factor [Bacteroidota bacterium]